MWPIRIDSAGFSFRQCLKWQKKPLLLLQSFVISYTPLEFQATQSSSLHSRLSRSCSSNPPYNNPTKWTLVFFFFFLLKSFFDIFLLSKFMWGLTSPHPPVLSLNLEWSLVSLNSLQDSANSFVHWTRTSELHSHFIIMKFVKNI